MKTLRYTLRHLARARAYTLINLLGLACSLFCSVAALIPMAWARYFFL